MRKSGLAILAALAIVFLFSFFSVDVMAGGGCVLMLMAIGIAPDLPPGGGDPVEVAEELRHRYDVLYREMQETVLIFFTIVDEGEKKFGIPRKEYDGQLKKMSEKLLRLKEYGVEIEGWNFLAMSSDDLATIIDSLRGTNAVLEDLILSLQKNINSMKEQLEAKKREVPA